MFTNVALKFFRRSQKCFKERFVKKFYTQI